jgi:hypothetical protein
MDTACHHASPIEDTSLEPDMGCSSKHNRTQPEILTINAAETLDIISAVLHWNRLFSGILVELKPAFTKMRVVSQQCMPIEHERFMNECTDGFEDSHTHTNECVGFS